MQFSQDVTNATRSFIIPEVYDTINKGSPLAMSLLQTAKDWSSGVSLEVVYQYANSTQGGVTGIADKLSTSRDVTTVKGTYYPKQAYQNVVAGNIELVLNQGKERVYDFLKSQFLISAKALQNTFADQLYNGTGAGDQFDSLDVVADDATNYSTIGGLAKATYTTLKGYYLASAGALTLAKMATAYDAVEIGIDSPSVIATTKSIWSTYESLLSPTVRAGYNTSGYPKMDAMGMINSKADGLQGNGGFSVLFFRGTPVVKDESVPSGRMYLINRGSFNFYGIDYSGIEGMETYSPANDKGTPKGVFGNPVAKGFGYRIMMSPVDQLAQVGYLLVGGDFVSTNPRLQGQIRGLS